MRLVVRHVFWLGLLTCQVATLDAFGRAWIVPKGVKFGNLNRLILGENTWTDTNNNEQILVATKAIGLNFADIFTVLGYYQAANLVRTPPEKTTSRRLQPLSLFPANNSKLKAFCPGLEFSGIVVNNNAHFSKGDRVFGFTRFGAYADIVGVREPSFLSKLPDNWSFAQGASFLVNALTAWHGLVTVAGMPDASEKRQPPVVLVHSAAGGVGLWASEIAARRGAIVVGIVGNDSKCRVWYERIRPLCPSCHCMVRSSATFEQDLRDAVIRARGAATTTKIMKSPPPPEYQSSSTELARLGWGIDYVMESYGGAYFKASLDLINPGGSLATFGSTSYNGDGQGGTIPFWQLVVKYLRRPSVDPGFLTRRNIRVGGFNLIFLTENTEELSRAFDNCIACLCGDDAQESSLAKISPPWWAKHLILIHKPHWHSRHCDQERQSERLFFEMTEIPF